MKQSSSLEVTLVDDARLLKGRDEVRSTHPKALSATANEDRSALIKRGFEQPAWYLRKRSFNIRLRAEIAQEFLGGRRFQNILDIGCGDGSISVPLLKTHNRLTLLDLSSTMLDIARSRVRAELRPQMSAVNEPFMQASLPQAPFDLIISIGVLAYVEDTRGFVTRIASLLAPGGYVLMECTDSSHFVNYLGRILGRMRNLLVRSEVPLSLHTSSEVEAIFRDLGFLQCGAFRYSLPPPGVRRILSHNSLYRMVRVLHGTAAHNRMPRLGDECLYCFRHDGEKV